MYVGLNVRFRKCGILIIVGLLILWYLNSSRKPQTEQVKQTISLKSLLASAIRASEIGGSQVVAVHDNVNLVIQSKGKTKEGINDPVTAADYRSHCAMYMSLKNAFPSVTVISEEKSVGCDENDVSNVKSHNSDLDHVDDVSVNAEDITVWIDPLDATKEFTENLLNYVTTMVCVAYKGEPIIGVIHKPFEPKATYWAWVAHAFSDNIHLKPPNHVDKVPILIVSQSHAGTVKNASKIAFGDNLKVISAAGAGYKVLEVVAGNATAYVHMTAIKKWDICAGAAILSALGGKMTSLFDTDDINFSASDSIVLNSGLLATMKNHKWYLNKFLKSR